MEENQRGFTLVETLVAVACIALLLAAGGALLGGMHAGALRGAADDFDADLAAARGIAASSGNGATIAVIPRTDARGGTLPGFVLRVYSGRPTAAGAVTPANVMAVESDASIAEHTFGKPPFALFLSSAGHPTGLAAYPTVEGTNVAFSPVASQPPCPSPAIAVTFTSPQGATETRTLQCNAAVAGVSVPNASPTPNVPVVVPSALVAHWTSDSKALKFAAAEFGYTHWFASNTGATCGAVAAYTAGWPYAAPQNPAEASLAPNPPAQPYSWPNNAGGSMNDAPAPFILAPVRGSPGLCRVDIVDDYGQHAGAQVQVMGDIAATPTSITFAAPASGAQTVTFSKSYDAEPLKLMWGGSCGGLLSIDQSSQSTQPSAVATPTTATLTLAPKGASGSCSLTVSDQYGEPLVAIPVVINAAAAMNTWPQKIVMASTYGTLATIAPRRAPLDVAMALNAVLGGGFAEAATPIKGCLAQALMADGVTPDPEPAQAIALGIHTDPASGCYINTAGTPVQGQMVVYEPSGKSETFADEGNCGLTVSLGPWNPSIHGVKAGLGTKGGAAASACQVILLDGVNPTPVLDHGIVNAQVVPSFTVTLGYISPHCIKNADGVTECAETAHIFLADPVGTHCAADLRSASEQQTYPEPAPGSTYPLSPAPTTVAAWDEAFKAILDSVFTQWPDPPPMPVFFDTSGCPST
ncbi:MAG: prepilin-type N-terminal cleavage/methylation domain-containing protein [Candidatus Eremiobacteraeota bacterium]|nr:prepilin-type N-terminal cleavage/methylation domain-containing protein [Candidatus Eremiobacteraeota bacterium]